MGKQSGGGKQLRGAKAAGIGARAASNNPSPRGVGERAAELVLRLETASDHLQTAAEELDRIQARLRENEQLDPVRQRLADLCEAWKHLPLRGDRGHAWLTLVGAFDLKEHTQAVADLAGAVGLPAPLRAHACRILPRLGGDTARDALLAVVTARTEPQIRIPAAEALAELRDRTIRPQLEALLEDDLPRTVWTAVSATVDRLR